MKHFPQIKSAAAPPALIRRTFDPSFLNRVLNDPAVRPHVAGDDVLDITAQALNPANFILQTDMGGFIVIAHEPTRYEVHSQFLPGHGAHSIKAMREAQEWMFTRTDCETIISRVPVSNRAAKGFALTGGLRTIFEREDAQLGPCQYVELRIMDWAMRTAPLQTRGHCFHAVLETAKAAGGSDLSVHPDDPAHDRAVGAAMLMIERGHPIKGVAFYNRWARMAGYQTISLLSLAPVVVDVVDAILGLGDKGMEVVLCR